MAEIALRNVSKSYGAVRALRDLSLTVADNEFFCVFGPPSAGKTTILRLILGLETPDEGQVLIDGRDVTHEPPAARNVAMVFQNLALFPHMSAGDNVRFPLRERGTDAATVERRVAEVAEKLLIVHVLHKPPSQLSGGERQRVAIARALVRDPAAYLMDDPISALDARLREETRVELKRLQREAGRTLIYVTHDQEEAMSVADRMAILVGGVLRQVGTPTEVYDSPADAEVARLLGSPAMNLVPLGARGAIRLPEGAIPRGADRLGVRPEDLDVRPWEDGAGDPARVVEVEPLGGYTVVTLDAGGAPLRALLRGQPALAEGGRVALRVAPGRAHFFGPDGAALRAPAP